MAEKETKNNPKDLVEATPEELNKEAEDMKKNEEQLEGLPEETKEELETPVIEETREEKENRERVAAWKPRTKLGIEVKEGKAKDIDKILLEEKKILEPEIVDSLLNIQSDLVLIGQAKGKFGGGKRRAWRQTQKKTKEGNVLSFSCMAVVGDKQGHLGLGTGKAKETLPAREKALRKAKLNLTIIKRGFETPEKGSQPHTVPFKVEGKAGSVRIKLLPAPRGTGLVVADECKKILQLAGIEDVYSKTTGKTRTTFNLAKACMDALLKTNKGILE